MLGEKEVHMPTLTDTAPTLARQAVRLLMDAAKGLISGDR